MKTGQVVSLVIGCLLLLPGGCFMLFGIGFSIDTGGELSGGGGPLIAIGVAILAFAGLLFWIAFRKRGAQPSGSGEPPISGTPSS